MKEEVAMERVVITGMGAITPLGNDVETFWTRLVRGDSGITTIDAFDTTRFKVKIAGLVRDFDAKELFGLKEARRMDRFSQFAVAAADQALADSGIDLEQVNKERMGVY